MLFRSVSQSRYFEDKNDTITGVNVIRYDISKKNVSYFVGDGWDDFSNGVIRHKNREFWGAWIIKDFGNYFSIREDLKLNEDVKSKYSSFTLLEKENKNDNQTKSDQSKQEENKTATYILLRSNL